MQVRAVEQGVCQGAGIVGQAVAKTWRGLMARWLPGGPGTLYVADMKFFWFLFAVDILFFLVAFFFFLDGLSDGTVNSRNMALWLPLVCVPAALLLGGLRLKAIGRPGAAKLLLALPAVPAILGGTWLLLLAVLFATHPGAYR